MSNNSIIKCATNIMLIIILILFGTGCIGNEQIHNSINEQSDFNLQYNFASGDKFSYNIEQVTENPTNKIPIHYEMLISKVNNEQIFTNLTLKKTTSGNTTTSFYTMIMNCQGSLIEMYPNTKIIPEIQPEFPNYIEFPKESISKGNSWTNIFNKTINESSSNMSYQTVGIKNSSCLGLKTISTNAGEFDCIGIKSDVNFTSSTKTKIDGKDVYVITRGKLSGIDWVDKDYGFLVESEYNKSVIVTTDLIQTYEELGFENFTRESKINSHTFSTLENIEQG